MIIKKQAKVAFISNSYYKTFTCCFALITTNQKLLYAARIRHAWTQWIFLCCLSSAQHAFIGNYQDDCKLKICDVVRQQSFFVDVSFVEIGSLFFNS